MHSRIFQISDKPIEKCDYINEAHYWDHWFVDRIADYVNGDTDRESDIEWLKSCYEYVDMTFGKDEGGEYFIINDKTKYFAKHFEEFHKAAVELSQITLDDFVNRRYSASLYRLKEADDDEFGFYVEWGSEGGTDTFDGFMRYAEVGVKYYIGATIDYHW